MPTATRLLVLAATLAGCVTVEAQSQPPSQSRGEASSAEQQRTPTENQERTADQQPPNTPVAALIKPETQSNQAALSQAASEHQEAASLLDGLESLDANWVIALLTISLFAVAYREFRLNQANLNTIRAVERAWVGLTQINFNQLQPNQSPVVALEFKNHGQTPARVGLVRAKIEIFGYNGRPTDAQVSASLSDSPDYGSEHLLAPMVLMPGEQAWSTLSYPKELTPAIYKDIQAGTAIVCVYGCVEYRDTLDATKHRMTRFGRRFDPRASQILKTPIFYILKKPGYNDAD